MADNRFFNLMIVSDIDGTFLGPRASLVERNLEAVERFKSMGGLFTFSSGRANSNIFGAIPQTSQIVNAPLSLANGSCLYDAVNMRSIKDFFMKPQPILELAKYVRTKYPQVGVRASAPRGFVFEQDDAVSLRNVGHLGADAIEFQSMSEWQADDWYKIVVVGEPEQLAVIREDCIARFGENELAYDKSDATLLELHRRDRNKAAMLETYRELYAAEGRDLFFCAVGDYDNDRELLAAADLAVCPENATDAIKALCDVCLCHHSLGVIGDLVEYLENNYRDAWGKV